MADNKWVFDFVFGRPWRPSKVKYETAGFLQFNKVFHVIALEAVPSLFDIKVSYGIPAGRYEGTYEYWENFEAKCKSSGPNTREERSMTVLVSDKDHIDAELKKIVSEGAGSACLNPAPQQLHDDREQSTDTDMVNEVVLVDLVTHGSVVEADTPLAHLPKQSENELTTAKTASSTQQDCHYILHITLPGWEGRRMKMSVPDTPPSVLEVQRATFKRLCECSSQWEADNEDDEADFMENYIPKVGSIRYGAWRARQMSNKTPERRTKAIIRFRPVISPDVYNATSESRLPSANTNASALTARLENTPSIRHMREHGAEQTDGLSVTLDIPKEDLDVLNGRLPTSSSGPLLKSSDCGSKSVLGEGSLATAKAGADRSRSPLSIGSSIDPPTLSEIKGFNSIPKIVEATFSAPPSSDISDKKFGPTNKARALQAAKIQRTYPDARLDLPASSPEEDRWSYYQTTGSQSTVPDNGNINPAPSMGTASELVSQGQSASNSPRQGRYIFCFSDTPDREFDDQRWIVDDIPSLAQLKTRISQRMASLHDDRDDPLVITYNDEWRGPNNWRLEGYEHFVSGLQASYATAETYSQPANIEPAYIQIMLTPPTPPTNYKLSTSLPLAEGHQSCLPRSTSEAAAFLPSDVEQDVKLCLNPPNASSPNPAHALASMDRRRERQSASRSVKTSSGRYGISSKDYFVSSLDDPEFKPRPNTLLVEPVDTVAAGAGPASHRIDEVSSAGATRASSPTQAPNDLERVSSRDYLQGMMEGSNNTSASTRLLRIMQDEAVSPASSLGIKLLDLIQSLRIDDGPTVRTSESTRPIASTTANQVVERFEDRLNDFADMLNHIAEKVGVKFEAGDEASKETSSGGDVNDERNVDERERVEEDSGTTTMPFAGDLLSQLMTSSQQVAESVDAIQSPYQTVQALPYSPDTKTCLEEIVRRAQQLEKDDSELTYESRDSEDRVFESELRSSGFTNDMTADGHEHRVREDAATSKVPRSSSPPILLESPTAVPARSPSAVSTARSDRTYRSNRPSLPAVDDTDRPRPFTNPFNIPPRFGHSYRPHSRPVSHSHIPMQPWPKGDSPLMHETKASFDPSSPSYRGDRPAARTSGNGFASYANSSLMGMKDVYPHQSGFGFPHGFMGCVPPQRHSPFVSPPAQHSVLPQQVQLQYGQYQQQLPQQAFSQYEQYHPWPTYGPSVYANHDYPNAFRFAPQGFFGRHYSGGS